MEIYFQRTFFLTAFLLSLGYAQNLGLQTNDVGDNFLSTKINWLFDRFLSAYKHELIIRGETVMPIPNFEEHFSTKVVVFNINGYLSVVNGSIKDLSTLERTGDVFLDRDGNDVILTAQLGMTDFKVNYERYELSLMGITQTGGINATVLDDSVCMKIKLTLKPKCKVKLQSLEIEKLGNIDISISGLGPMNSLTDDLSSWIVTHITHSYQTKLQSLIFDDFTWRQIEELIIIHVPLKGVPVNKVDVFTSDVYIKVHFPPFLFELCLARPINDERSHCTLAENEAVFELIKQINEPWDTIEANLTKAEALDLKQNVINEALIKAEEKKKENAAKKGDRQRLAVSQQIKLNAKEHELIDSIRNNEKKVAMKSLEVWKKNQTIVEHIRKKDDKAIFNDVDFNKKPSTTKYSKPEEVIPSPRSNGTINVSFTPRAFPTPCRQSKLAEEEEWLKKQVEARRKIGFVAEDLRPEEQNPDWLLEKGESFYKNGNYLGAISAYSHGIKLNENLHSFYVSRSAAQFQLGNLQRVLEDTTKALELMTPHVAQNARDRFLCHSRRGYALLKLRLPKPALSDLETALSLDSTDKQVLEGIEEAKKQISDDK